MKYIVNENNSCGQASISDEARNNLLEAMGFEPTKEEAGNAITESVAPQTPTEESDAMPSLYSWDDAVFALEEEVFEIEGDLFLKAVELDAGTRMMLGEAHADLFINEVNFEEDAFSLGDIYDLGGEIFIKLDEAGKKGDESDVKGKKGDKPDFTADDRKGDKSKTKPGKKDFDKDDDDDDDCGDPRAFGGKKGDKSKSHGGKDFMKDSNGDDMSDADIDAAMNKNAPRDPQQVKLRRKLEKGKPNKDAEAVAADDAK